MDSYSQHSSAHQQQPSSTTEPTQPTDETYQYSYQYSSSSTMETPRWSSYSTHQPSSSPEEPPQSAEVPVASWYWDSSSSTAARPRSLAESSQNTNNPDIYYTSEQVANLQYYYDRNIHNPDSTDEAYHYDGPSGQDTQMPYCLYPGCDSKPFRRIADLQRHYRNVHNPDWNKDAYHCDYSKCTRAKEPFRRRDHFRDHLREYHREDIQKRGEVVNKKDQSNSGPSWWRCARCLARVSFSQSGSECPQCKGSGESVSQKKRRGH